MSGGGGTFVVKRDNEKFIPLVIAGGAGGCDDISAEQKIFVNGQTNKYGGRSVSIATSNTNEGSSGECLEINAYMGGSGFISGPNKKYKNRSSFAKELPKVDN